MRPSAPWLRRLLWIALLVGAVVGPLAVRAAWEGRAELDLATAARERGDVDREIEHLGRAARWRLPIASHDERALGRLTAIGDEAFADDRQTALAAYREARRALLGTRAWGVSDPELLTTLNAYIASLMAAQEHELSGADEAAAYEQHYQLLAQAPGPDPSWANLTALAFIAWLIATTGFMLRSLDARGRLRPKTAVRWGAAALVLFVVWTVLLANAHG